MLGVTRYPDAWPGLAKLDALAKAAAATGGELHPGAAHGDLPGRSQPRRRRPVRLPAVRRLRDRVQPRREEHRGDELPAARGARTAHSVHRGRGAYRLPSPAGGWIVTFTAGRLGSGPSMFVRAAGRRARRGRARLHRDPVPIAGGRPAGVALGSGTDSAATATRWPTRTTATTRYGASASAAARLTRRHRSAPPSPACCTSAPTTATAAADRGRRGARRAAARYPAWPRSAGAGLADGSFDVLRRLARRMRAGPADVFDAGRQNGPAHPDVPAGRGRAGRWHA